MTPRQRLRSIGRFYDRWLALPVAVVIVVVQVIESVTATSVADLVVEAGLLALWLFCLRGAWRERQGERTYPANPYLACDTCGQRVVSWRTGIRWPIAKLEPCGHVGTYRDTCPAWSPTSGCLCDVHLGERPEGHLPDPVQLPA